jgi:eukaryotic-like serine/threonine-protein kinase
MEREVQVGQLVAGKYRIQQMLGRGGMGVVMAALHEHLNQHVALKFLTDDAYQQPEAVARFLREARSAVQIQSEHVARVMDVGTLDSGAPYIVMEYLRGLDLKEVSTRRGPLPINEAVDYVLQACDAVAEAHSLGIVHRDLKPSNLFLTERPDGSPLVKVLDFGISKALNAGRGGETSKQQMTASAAIMGSPQYMSPEQIRSSKNVDARADVWALGTILHELAAGAPAYVADTVPGLLAMIVADAPPPLSSARPDAPPELEAIILRCLEKDRERRFANVAEFARALERFASVETRPLVRRIARVLGDSSSSSQSYRSIPPGLATQHEPVNQTHNTWAHTGRLSEAAPVPFHARPTVQLGAGLGLVGVGLLAAWFLFSGAGPTASTPIHTTAQTTQTTKSVKPETDAKAAADTTGMVLAPAIVRPVREPDPPVRPATAEPPVQASAPPPAAEDDDPRSPHNFRDDDTPYPSASAKKKELAAAQKRARPKARPQPSAPPQDEAPSVSPEAAPKKSNPLDLFDDTK